MNDIVRLVKRAVDEAAEGNTDLCILLESKSLPDRWVQLTWDTINAAYPFANEPIDRVREIGLPLFDHIEVTAWEPNKFATFGHGADDPGRIADFVSGYFEKVLEVSAAMKDLRVEEQQL